MNASPWSSSSSPRLRVLSEDDFRGRLVPQGATLMPLLNGIMESAPEEWSQRQLEHVSQASFELEQFLDDFGARENKNFFKLRELAAFVRWLSHAMGGYVHLHSRLPSYAHADPEWVENFLAPTVRDAALALGEMLLSCAQGFREEWKAAKLDWPTSVLRVDALASDGPRLVLERDRAAGSPQSDKGSSKAAKFVGQYLRFVRAWGGRATEPILRPEDQVEFLSTLGQEAVARKFEGRAHNLQSLYDSLMSGSPEEVEFEGFPRLRAALSSAFHLLEAVTGLTHLFERHDALERRGESRALFERFVGQKKISEIIVNSGIIVAYRCLRAAAPIAEALLPRLTRQGSLMLTLPAGVVLHARPISLIVRIATQYGTPVEMQIGDERANAFSIMSMLVLAGSNPSRTEIQFFGDEQPLQDMKTLFKHRLGEDGLDDIVAALPYLG